MKHCPPIYWSTPTTACSVKLAEHWAVYSLLCSGYIYNSKSAHSFFVNSTFTYMMQKPMVYILGVCTRESYRGKAWRWGQARADSWLLYCGVGRCDGCGGGAVLLPQHRPTIKHCIPLHYDLCPHINTLICHPIYLHISHIKGNVLVGLFVYAWASTTVLSHTAWAPKRVRMKKSARI